MLSLAAHCSGVVSGGAGAAAAAAVGGGLAVAVTVTANIDMHSAQPIEREADRLLVRGERVCLRVCLHAPPQAISSAYQRDVWGQAH